MAEAKLSAPAIRIYNLCYIRQVLFFRTLINSVQVKWTFAVAKMEEANDWLLP